MRRALGSRFAPTIRFYVVAGAFLGQWLLGVLAQMPTFLVFAGALLLAARLIRGASREGIFTLRVAGRLRTLGWFVLAGEV